MLRFRLDQGWLASVSAVVVLIAGVLKLADLPMWADDLLDWQIIPRAAVPGLAIVVPAAEMFTAGAFLLGIGDQRSRVALITVLLVLTVAVGAEWSTSGEVACGCFGAWSPEREGIMAHPITFLVRNGLLILMLLPLRVRRVASGTSVSARAFTLTELLLVIVLIGTLLAMLTPALSRVTLAAREARTLSDLRSHAAVLTMYTTDFNECYPHLADPDATLSVLHCRTDGGSIAVSYFEVNQSWFYGLADAYYDGQWRARHFRSALAAPGEPGGTYRLPCTLLAAPEFYKPEERVPPPRQLRAVRTHELLFPHKKSLLIDSTILQLGARIDRLPGNPRFAAATTDGRAAMFSYTRTGPQYHLGDGPWWEYGGHHGWDLPMAHGINGVHGRDVID